MANVLAVLVATSLVAACGTKDPDTLYPDEYNYRTTGDVYTPPESVLGPGGLSVGLFGDDSQSGGGGGAGGVGVNSYLWRASLDTVSFMPLASADPFGGVIITDWFTPSETPNERFKINIFILSRQLRADGIQAKVFRQRLRAPGEEDGAGQAASPEGGDGRWIDLDVDPQTAFDLENAILTRARQLRIASLQ